MAKAAVAGIFSGPPINGCPASGAVLVALTPVERRIARPRFRLHMVLALAALTACAGVQAATWTGGGADDNWTTPGNWGGTAPVAGDDLVFGNAGAARTTTGVNNFGAGTSFNNITFNGNDNYTIVGNQITVTGSISVTSGTHSLGTPLVFGATRTVTVSAGTLTLSGVVSGAGGLTKAGAGTLALSAANTYAGGTDLTAGTVRVNTDTSLGTGTVTFNGGRVEVDNAGWYEGRITYGTNQWDEGTPIPKDAVRLDTPRVNSTDGAAFGDNSTWGYFGKLIMPGGGATWTFAERFDDNAKLIIDGVQRLRDQDWNAATMSTITLGPGAHTVEIRVGQGGGGVGPTSPWTVGVGYDSQGRATLDPTYFAPFTDPGDGSFLVRDLTIANAVTLNMDGEISILSPYGVATFAGVISGAGGPNKTGPGAAVLTAANDYAGVTTIGAGTLQVGNGGAAGSLGPGSVANSASLVFNRSDNITVGNVIGGTGSLTQAGAGTLTLSAVNSYTGRTIIQAGAVSIAAESALGANPGGFTADQLTLDGGVLITTATFALSDANRGLTMGPAGGSLDQASGTTFTVPNAIAGAGSLVKSGAGTLVLTSAAGSFSGGTDVRQGVLRTGGAGAVTGVAPGPLGTGALRLDGGVIEAGNSGAFSRTIAVTEAGGRLDAYGAARTVSSSMIANAPAWHGGLRGSYFNVNLRNVLEDDWRVTRAADLKGSRVDGPIHLDANVFGSVGERAAWQIGGTDGDWDTYSVQWDGWITIPAVCNIATRSDDYSRVWIDLNGNGLVDEVWGNNGWGGGAGGQGETTQTTHTAVPAGQYRIRVQYEEGGGGNVFRLYWSYALGASPEAGWYVIPGDPDAGDPGLRTPYVANEPGLRGSYFNTSFRAVTEDDWRASRPGDLKGSRVTGPLQLDAYAFGSAGERAAWQIAGTDADWENFSVQWDGEVTIPAACDIATRSDDGSRVWIDLDNDGVVDAGAAGGAGAPPAAPASSPPPRADAGTF